tara:strand:- start:2033 stop:2737 length:705 start_codon:yes stop_codon:yes gene_type:complete
MVSIDTVYQKVLMFANKEQRGYITPQEFNMFADHAQKEIFEQYFYDLNQFSRVPGNSSEYSDIIHNINEKIAVFERTDGAWAGGNISSTSGEVIYRLGTMIYDGKEIEEVQQNEILYINQSPLTKPSLARPVYVRRRDDFVKIYPDAPSDIALYNTNASFTYLTKPTKPSWGYVVVLGKAMYDPGNTTNFELHAAEESELVYKILKFAGLAMKRDDIAKGGQGLEQLQTQQEKQ